MGLELAEFVILGLGIAFSPMPVSAILLMALAADGVRTSVAFLIGWVLGICAALVVFAWLSTLLPPTPTTPDRVSWAAPLGLGVILVAFGTLNALRNRRAAAGAGLPRWLSSIDKLTPGRAVVGGFLFAAFRPKNLVLTAAAGLLLSATEHIAQFVLGAAVFAVVAASSMALPVLAVVFGGSSVQTGLARTRSWLLRHVRTITSGTAVLLGFALVAVGISRL